ncbi:MAG: phage tail protein [Candidatus Brocadiaceae bacterium]|nr:phage tail protein [Candidatus Brocadiaceae bacterium]
MPNRREFDHLISSKFKVEIEGITVAQFTAFEGLESTTEVVTFVDAGDLLVRKRPGRTSYSNLVLKRGYINTDELWRWHKAVIDGRVERKSGSIIALADDGSEIVRYNFFEGWPCRWKGFEFDAKKAGSLFEEIEIVVEKVEKS